MKGKTVRSGRNANVITAAAKIVMDYTSFFGERVSQGLNAINMGAANIAVNPYEPLIFNLAERGNSAAATYPSILASGRGPPSLTRV